MVSRAAYDQVGGLDESFTISLNDVDFCLKLREAGYLNIFTPFAELYHYESKTRGMEEGEKLRRYERVFSSGAGLSSWHFIALPAIFHTRPVISAPAPADRRGTIACVDVAEAMQDLMEVMKTNRISMPHGLTMPAARSDADGRCLLTVLYINMVEIASEGSLKAISCGILTGKKN